MKRFLPVALTIGLLSVCMSNKAHSHAIADARDICANAADGKIPYKEAARKFGLPGFYLLLIMVYPDIVITIKIR